MDQYEGATEDNNGVFRRGWARAIIIYISNYPALLFSLSLLTFFLLLIEKLVKARSW